MASRVGYCFWISRPPRSLLALTMVLLITLAAAAHAQGQALQTLYSFMSGTDGAMPQSDLWHTATGIILYGTTTTAGNLACGPLNSGCGTVFQLKPGLNGTWTETVLYSFPGAAQGQSPKAGVVRDKQGSVFGTTTYGGAGQGAGMIFELQPPNIHHATWKELVLHDFSGTPDGANPEADLVIDTQGNIYGTTVNGGTANLGSVFKIDKTGRYSKLYSFQGGTDGQYPQGGLVQDAMGNFYGTTTGGGSLGNFGTIFQFDPLFTKKTVLYNFGAPTDGQGPLGTLTIDSTGTLYGATQNGGDATCGCGIVFLLAPPAQQGGMWNESVKYRFTGGMDGANPGAGVIRDMNGVLYGTTTCGGVEPLCWGTIYKVDQSGNETVLWRFTDGADGGSPAAALVFDEKQKYVYGTASSGGANTVGLVFRIQVN